MTSPEPSPPEPPEEPLASDCCGSGCATCVYDIYDQQRAQYERALAAWKQKHGDTHPLLKVKRSGVSSNSAETVERVDVNALRERLFAAEQPPDAVSGDDDDDDDGGDGFNDAELSVSASYAGVASEGGVGAFDNSVVTNLTQLPASVARGVRVGDDSDAILAFRRDDDGQWARISSLTVDREGDDASSFSTTTLRLASSSSPPQQHVSLLSAFRPGDTVEALCMPSRFAVEEFLRTFAASSSSSTSATMADSDGDRTAELLSAHGRTGSLLEEAFTARGAAHKLDGPVPFPISDGVFLDVDRFPFVSSPLPPWLERCCSLLRTQRPELRTRGGLQTLSLGQLLRTVVDVSSWAALQRPLLRRMLDVAESKLHAEKVLPATASSSPPPLVPMQVAALQALVRLPTAAVHDWVRCAWVVSSSTQGDTGDDQHTVGTVGDLLKRFPSVAQQLQVAFPEQLLHLPIRRRQLRVDELVGSVSFLLSCCFRESVETQLFAPSAPLRDFTTGAAKRVLTLPRLLEVAPPLRGRIFSVAGVGDDGNSIDLLSNCERRTNVWYSCLDADAARAAAPPWAGIVSSRLEAGDVVGSGGESAMFLRSGAQLLAASNAKKRKMLAQAVESKSGSKPPPLNDSFADSLAALAEKLRRGNSGGNEMDVLFLCAGTGFAPFRFFLQRELALAATARAQRNVHLTMLFGLRHAPCARTVSFLSSLLSAGILSQVHVAVSRDAQSRAALEGGTLVVHPSARVPDLISAKSIVAPLSTPRGLLHVFSCGPPAFVAACRSAVTSSARTETDQAPIVWHNDDWSS